jgi:hypothetical protein
LNYKDDSFDYQAAKFTLRNFGEEKIMDLDEVEKIALSLI